MFKQIAAHEWRNLSSDRTLWWLTLLLAGVIGYGVYNGNAWVSFLQASIDQARKEEEERIDRAREVVASGKEPARSTRSPYSARDVGRRVAPRHAYLPPAPLAVLSVGQTDLYPIVFLVNTQSKERQKRHAELENPYNLMESRFDPAFVIVYLLPLVILALSYNLISEEKEQGTLAMVLSQPISLQRFVSVKIACRAVLVSVLVVGFSLAALMLAGVDLLEGRILPELLLLVGLIGGYAAFWFSLAVLTNAFGRGSATNAVVLATLWLLLVVIVPSGLNMAVRILYPMPSRAEFIVAAREASLEAQNQKAQILSRYFDDHPEFVISEDDLEEKAEFDTTQYALEMKIEESTRPVEARYERQLLRQQAEVSRLRFLSPAIVMQESLNDIAGTGTLRYRHFASVVDEYHQQWRDFFVPRIFGENRMTLEDYDQIPVFSFVEQPGERIVGRVLGAYAGLLVPAAVTFLLGLWRLRHYVVAR